MLVALVSVQYRAKQKLCVVLASGRDVLYTAM